MDINILNFLRIHNIPYENNISLQKKTWIHRGGLCNIFISPQNRDQLVCVVQYLYRENIEFLVIGHTSNIYILNGCNISVVLSTKKCKSYELKNGYVYCEAGVGLINLANDMVKKGIVGFEYLTDLPGTVAAAVYNNSSCKNNSISQLLIKAEIILENGDIVSMTADEFEFKYRSSILKEKKLKGTIVSITLRAEFGNAESLINIAEQNKKERTILLSEYSKCLGSTFSNCFNKGKMPLLYYIPFRLYNLWLKITERNISKRKRRSKDFICRIAGYPQLAAYISDEDIIMFIWADEKADIYFPQYLEFMDKVYRTDNVEIEIIGA